MTQAYREKDLFFPWNMIVAVVVSFAHLWLTLSMFFLYLYNYISPSKHDKEFSILLAGPSNIWELKVTQVYFLFFFLSLEEGDGGVEGLSVFTSECWNAHTEMDAQPVNQRHSGRLWPGEEVAQDAHTPASTLTLIQQYNRAAT